MTDFKAKMHQIRFPDPAGGAYSAPPHPIAGLGGRFAAGGGLGWEEEGIRGGRGSGGGEREGPKLLLNRAPQSLATPLSDCHEVRSGA